MSKKIEQKDFALKVFCGSILFCVLMFAAARAALLLLYPAYFGVLTTTEILTAFAQGLRFDLAVIVLFAGIPLLLLNIPVQKKWWLKTWLYVAAFFIMVMGGFLIGDIIYFPNVNRHITDELLYIGSDLGYLVKYILFKTPLQLALLLAFCGWFVYSISKYINKNWQKQPVLWGKTALKLFCMAAFILMGVRGHFGKDKPIGVADVYKYADTPKAAALTMNGVFSTFQVSRKGGMDTKNNYPFEQAAKIAQQIYIAKDEKVLDPSYPLMRQTTAKLPRKDINVVIVMFEGWSPYYVDALEHHNMGVTPVFDDIARNGVVFSNAYSMGTRSIFGFAAILTSAPLTPGLPMFGYGMELNSFPLSFKNFADRDYFTAYAQTSLRHSYRMCALAKYLGAHEQYGWEDLPQRLPYIGKAPFGYDYDAYMMLADRIKARKQKNFFTMLFTGITHDPFVKTLEKFDVYKGGTKEDGYKNSLLYADWSIGEFMQRAKAEGWFDNTVFVFTSDHTTNYNDQNDTIYERFHIPLVIYAPKMLKAQKYDYIVSQLDIMPTLYKMAGIDKPYTAFGKDLFDNSAQRYAFIYDGSAVGLISEGGAVEHNRNKLVATEARQPSFDAKDAQDKLLALDKAATTLLQTNKWFKDEQ